MDAYFNNIIFQHILFFIGDIACLSQCLLVGEFHPISLVSKRRYFISPKGNFIGNPRWSSDGRAIYFLKTGLRGRFVSDLMKVRYDAGSRKLDGEPYVVLDNLYVVKDPGIGTTYSISNDGKQILFEQKSNRMDLWIDRKIALPSRISFEKDDYEVTTVSWSKIKIDKKIKDKVFQLKKAGTGWTEEITPLEGSLDKSNKK